MKKLHLITLLIVCCFGANAWAHTSTSIPDTLANFQSDYNETNNADTNSAWKYYWNQPEGWVKDDSATTEDEYQPGTPNSNNILDENSYVLLEYATTLYTPDGDEFGEGNENFRNNSPAGFLRLGPTGGGAGLSNYDESSTNLVEFLFDTYLIISYTVEEAGIYYVGNSSFEITAPDGKGNGVRMMVLENDKDEYLFHQLFSNNGTIWNFDTEPKEFEANSEIYVCIGANGNSAHDNFKIDFSIIKTDSIPVVDKQTDFYVTDYGAKGDGVTNDIEAIRAAMADFTMTHDTAYLHFEQGKTYRCEGGGHLIYLDSTKNKTVLGNNALILAEPRVLGITVEDCENILIKDLAFDSDPLSWTQGTVMAVDKANKKFTLKIDDGYPIPEKDYSNTSLPNNWGMLWGAEDDNIKEELVYLVACSEPNGQTVDFTVRDDMDHKLDEFVPGIDRFTIDVVGIGGSLNFIKTSKDITLKDINIYAARSLNNVISDNIGRVTMDSVNLRRKPGTNRLLAGYRDGFHCKRNVVGPIIQNCYVEGICDDAINLSGGYFYVTAKSSDTQFTIDDVSNFSLGDTLLFVDMKNGIELGTTTIAALTESEVTTANAITGVSPGAVKAENTTYVMNLSKSNSGFIVRNNTFHNHRRYAMLIRCQNGLIQNNTGSKISAGIMLVNEVGNFYEGPFPGNILIEGNSFTNIRGQGYPIFVDAKTYGGVQDQLIKDITIRNNTFGPSLSNREAAIFRDATNISFENNTLIGDGAQKGLFFGNCTDIHILCNNTYNGVPITTVDDGINLNVAPSELHFDCTSNGVEDLKDKGSDVSLFYSQGTININTDIQSYQVSIFDLSGKLRIKALDGCSAIDISHFLTGVYVVRVAYEGKIENYRIVKI